MGVKKKIVLLGDSAVGKTSLIRRFVFDIFEDAYVATIGSKVSSKQLWVPTPSKNVDLTLMIWDVLGREGYTGFHARTFAGAHGALLVSDGTRKETLRSLERYWIPSLLKVVENLPIVLVSNKSDLVGSEKPDLADVRGIASRHNVGLERALPSGLQTAYATSAKTGENVETAFLSLGHLVLSGKLPDDPIKELYEGLLAMGISRSADTSTPVGALDAIIVDFCEGFPEDKLAMPLLRLEIIRAGIDVRSPRREGLLRLVEYLAEAESEFRDQGAVLASKEKRLQWARVVGS